MCGLSRLLKSAAHRERRSERRSEIKERKVSAALQIFKERKGERRSERQVSAQKSAVFQRLYLKTNLSYTTNHSLFKRSVFEQFFNF